MAPRIANDVIEIAIHGVMGGQDVVNVVHMKVDRPIDPGNSESIAQRVLESWQDNIVTGVCGSIYTVTGAHYIDLDSLTGDTGDVSPNPAKQITGDQGQAVPANVALVVKKQVSGAPRGTRGWFMIPAIPEVVVDGAGIITDGALAAFNASLAAFQEDCESHDDPNNQLLALVTFPRNHITGKINGDGTGYPITGLAAEKIVGSQRDRLAR